MAKLVHHRRTSGGPRTRWTDDAVRDDLRAEFMREVETTAPEVLIFLRDEVWPLYRKVAHSGHAYVRPARWSEELRASVLECGRRFNLVFRGSVPAWVVNQFNFTLGFWTAHPEVTQHERLHWWGRGGYSGLRKVDYLAVELPPQIERSIYESDAAFEERVFATIEEIVLSQLQALSRRIAQLPEVRRKRRPEHYTWAVLHQILRWDFERIALRFHVAPVSVRNEVTDLKRQIGLNLSRGRH
jgi:hypothetical protein